MDELKRVLQERKWLVYTLAGVVIIAACIWAVRLFGSGVDDLLSVERLSEDVTVTFSDTGEKVQMMQGDVVRQLLDRPGNDPIAEGDGIANPKTGMLSGTVGSASAWKKMLEGVNRERSFKGKPSDGNTR